MSKKSVFVLLAMVVVVGAFVARNFSTLKNSNNTPLPAVATPTPESSTKTFTLVVKDKKLISGPQTLTVKEGDNVVIKITSDTDEELHLHGYDKSVDLTAGKEAELDFTANLTGRFPYELEHSKTEIGALEVQPK